MNAAPLDPLAEDVEGGDPEWIYWWWPNDQPHARQPFCCEHAALSELRDFNDDEPFTVGEGTIHHLPADEQTDVAEWIAARTHLSITPYCDCERT